MNVKMKFVNASIYNDKKFNGKKFILKKEKKKESII